jgi:hypothetical protein
MGTKYFHGLGSNNYTDNNIDIGISERDTKAEEKKRNVIEESKQGPWMDCMHNSVPGMLLSSLEDLSHTSILYYYRLHIIKIFEYRSQGDSKNKTVM